MPAILKTGGFTSCKNSTFQKFRSTHDNKDFLRLQAWTNEAEDEALLHDISDTGAQVLAPHKVWCFDGTLQTTPSSFKQVYVIMARSEVVDQGRACGYDLTK